MINPLWILSTTAAGYFSINCPMQKKTAWISCLVSRSTFWVNCVPGESSMVRYTFFKIYCWFFFYVSQMCQSFRQHVWCIVRGGIICQVWSSHEPYNSSKIVSFLDFFQFKSNFKDSEILEMSSSLDSALNGLISLINLFNGIFFMWLEFYVHTLQV